MPCRWIEVICERDPDGHLPVLATVSQLCPANPWWFF